MAGEGRARGQGYQDNADTNNTPTESSTAYRGRRRTGHSPAERPDGGHLRPRQSALRGRAAVRPPHPSATDNNETSGSGYGYVSAPSRPATPALADGTDTDDGPPTARSGCMTRNVVLDTVWKDYFDEYAPGCARPRTACSRAVARRVPGASRATRASSRANSRTGTASSTPPPRRSACSGQATRHRAWRSTTRSRSASRRWATSRQARNDRSMPRDSPESGLRLG
jgi:hypothetical protein